MPRGGKRAGAGRKPGKKETTPRKKNKLVPEGKTKGEVIDYGDSFKPLNICIDNYISAKNKKLYEELKPNFKTTLDGLKFIRDDLIIRYEFGRIAELEGLKAAKAIAKRKLDELNEFGTVDGKKIKENDVPATKQSLQLSIEAKYPKITTSLTSLATEIRQMSELIDRIEENRHDLKVNIFNLLDGKGDQTQTKNIKQEIFTLPPEAWEAEDAEVVQEKEEKKDEKKD